MKQFFRIEDCADWIDVQFGRDLKIATPLGLGKPNQLLNNIYLRIKTDPKRSLSIFTALTLSIPHPKTDLERKLMNPFAERQWGRDYPELLYSLDLAKNAAPPNIKVHEFYFQAGSAIGHSEMQKNYLSVNYTHVPAALFEQGVNLLLVMVAKHPEKPDLYSLSCNPDLSLDLFDLYQKNNKPLAIIGVTHPDLPYLTEDAEVNSTFFAAMVTSTEVNHALFALPREPVSPAEFMVGLRASLLMPDDGTLQVGIGSLSDALTHSLILRNQNPKLYQEITDPLISKQVRNAHRKSEFHQGLFHKGLYGTSEMVMDAFMHLRKSDILKREIYDSDHHVRRYLHGAFFLGSKDFYQWMSARFKENDHGLCMTKVSKVNDLYDEHELALRRQRKNARFYNTALEITLLGGVASDTLSNGQVMSGVGGQYNFVAMSHEMPDSHSVILFRSTHTKDGKKISNVNWGHDQPTLPRHLRDVFINEYGFSFTRGLSDEVVIQSNLEIADSDFQEGLRLRAIKNGKLSASYAVPRSQSSNSETALLKEFAPYQEFFKPFPFGSDFTPVEEHLIFALTRIKAALPFPLKILALLKSGILIPCARFSPELSRMDLLTPTHFKDHVYQCLLKGALRS